MVTKLYDLEKGDRFRWPIHDTASQHYYGTFIGCDGAYGKVRWDNEPYTKKDLDNFACWAKVVKLKGEDNEQTDNGGPVEDTQG